MNASLRVRSIFLKLASAPRRRYGTAICDKRRRREEHEGNEGRRQLIHAFHASERYYKLQTRKTRYPSAPCVFRAEGGRGTGSRDWKRCVEVCLRALARHERMTGRKIHTSWQPRNCTCKVETRERRCRPILPP